MIPLSWWPQITKKMKHQQKREEGEVVAEIEDDDMLLPC
jgi:hypothetical protein